MMKQPPPAAASSFIAPVGDASDLSPRQRSLARLAVAVIIVAVLAAGLWNLDGPPPWWDEGWTLSVARTWIEQGVYGRQRNNDIVAAGLAASFPVTAGVGLGMRLFGVGLWQGRLFGVLCTALALLLLPALTRRLYDWRVALMSLVAALFLTMHPQIHPLLQGRQVLAEIPMLVYLLAGLLLLAAVRPHRSWLLVPAVACLGLAWIAKAQTAPFLVIGLLVPTLTALFLRRWRVALMFGLTLLGSYLAMRSISWGIGGYLQTQNLVREPTSGLLAVVALVHNPNNRLLALKNTLIFGLPTLLGLGYALWILWHNRILAAADHWHWYMQLTLLALCSSWLAWFTLLSVGVPRYLAPPVLLGTPFVAVLLRDLSGNFNLVRSIEHLGALLTLRTINRKGFAAVMFLFLCVGPLAMTGLAFQRYYFDRDYSAQHVAAYFNAFPPDTVLIETYESELHFFLHQPYHYPADQTHVELNRRSLLHEPVTIDYRPLAADPDYLVVGQFARGNDLYRPVIERGAFQLIAGHGAYEIYARVRE